MHSSVMSVCLGVSVYVCLYIDVESPEVEFYDLVSNPERFTVHAGLSVCVSVCLSVWVSVSVCLCVSGYF